MKHESVGPALGFLRAALDDLRSRGLLREREAVSDGPALSFASNDYLGLANRPSPAGAPGAGASRLVTGDRPVHRALEEDAARLVGHPAALVFTSGYAANVGLLSALAGAGDLIVSDRLNHASIIDGARLSRASVHVIPHLDLAAAEAALAPPRNGRAFMVTESYFSMDADGPDLRALRAICDRHGAALIVDEAHALGVLGPSGRGLAAGAGVRVDALVGTFGKAFGAGGAFVAGSPDLVDWLWNRARSFVFSTGLSPVVAAAAREGLQIAGAEGWRRERALELAAHLRARLRGGGLNVPGFGPIIPCILGSAARALSVAARLRTRGVDVRAIRPPTVPEGTARLRLTVGAAHPMESVDAAADAILEAVA